MNSFLSKYKSSLFPLLLAALLFAGGCRRASHNGDIDGMWQIQKIEYSQQASPGLAGTTVSMPQLYLLVNLELFQLQRYGTKPIATGVLDYKENRKTFSVDWKGRVTDTVLEEFGLCGDPTRITIERLDSKLLVIRTDAAVVSCRRY